MLTILTAERRSVLALQQVQQSASLADEEVAAAGCCISAVAWLVVVYSAAVSFAVVWLAFRRDLLH